jgi:TetR/AcrR family transcriptional regulator, regulator of autoinduction and epiphytic fitness
MTKPKVKPTSPPVKREYRSPARDEQALATRRRIRAAAEELFLRDGYASTSMTAIAAAAGVSRPTVFNVFGSKVELLREIGDVTLAGDDEPIDVLSRPLGRAMLEATDPDELLRLHARLGAELLERVAPILTVLTEAAATDTEAAALVAFQEEGRFFGMGATVERLVELGALRDSITPARAQESLWMLSGLEPFQLAMRRGWSVDEYADWYLACARGLLLAD